MTVDHEWESFVNGTNIINTAKNDDSININEDMISQIYISTKTKIVYFNEKFNITDIFWRIPVSPYWNPKEGVLKKQIKLTATNEDEFNKITQAYDCIDGPKEILTLKSIRRDNEFKEVRKISVGISQKDLINSRIKKKGAFYNCFVLIIRIKVEDSFREVNLKIFNTGKVELTGMKDDILLQKSLDFIVKLMTKHSNSNSIKYKNKIDTVLINSNFHCGFFINRSKFYEILKYKYNYSVIYDPCSYPGIQCKYWFNTSNTGRCMCNPSSNCDCNMVSFMIFRTGSVLIVGNCDEEMLKFVYEKLKTIFINEYSEINKGINNVNEKTVKKKPKRISILVK
tara:strand:- start:546 stop:1565 length:1020 start_codon:yes stop_codon:yes gene_type:complete